MATCSSAKVPKVSLPKVRVLYLFSGKSRKGEIKKHEGNAVVANCKRQVANFENRVLVGISAEVKHATADKKYDNM